MHRGSSIPQGGAGAVVKVVVRSDRQLSNRCSQLDQRMSLVVRVDGKCFTVGTEVGVVADSTLVSVTSDIALSGSSSANWAITIDTLVLLFLVTDHAKLLVDGSKSVTRVNLSSDMNAS